MMIKTMKLPDGVDYRSVETRVNNRKAVLAKREFGTPKENATVLEMEDTIYLMKEDLFDKRVIDSLYYVESKMDRIRWSIDSMKHNELYYKSLGDILLEPNNILSKADSYRVSFFFAKLRPRRKNC
jgi:hypothetical protein